MTKEDCRGKCGGGCGIKEAFEDNGTPVGADTPKCKKWLKEHEDNCCGCPCELGCGKYAIYVQMQESFASIVLRLIEIKTPEEMKKFEEEFGEN